MKTNLNIDITKNDIQRLSEGNFDAFEKIYLAFFQKLYEFAYYYLKDDKISQDVVQDVFVSFWENRNKLGPTVNVQAYLYTSVKNKSLNKKRHHKIKQKYEELQIYFSPSVEMPDEVYHKNEIINAIEQAINDLPEKRRIIFVMHRFEKFTYKQIAEIQHISVKTVETQIKRAVGYIEKYLSKLLD